jgi:hypothetical protein
MISRETSIVVSARVDARDLATLVKAWTQQTGMPPRSTSQLVKEALGVLADSFTSQDRSLAVTDHEQAFQVIERAQLNARSDRSHRAMFRASQSEQVSFATQSGQDITQLRSSYEEQLEMIEATCQAARKMGESEESIAARKSRALEKLQAKYGR